MINRNEFLTLFSNQFGHALYDKKPITTIMDREPLIVDATTSIGLVSAVILNEKPSALLKGFIITEQEHYLGVGTAVGLLGYSVKRGKARQLELEAARQEAVLANETKTMFLANMSHELRTPLNAIIGFSDIMHTEMFGPLGSDRYKSYANDIHRSGQDLLGLVNDILDVAQIETGQMKLREQDCSLFELVEQSINQIGEQAGTGKVALINRVQKNMPEIYADDRKMRQVLLNLFSNAVKFTPEGGRVSAHACITSNGGIRIAITDTGIGISQEDIPRVQQKFAQVENSYQRKFKGAGLGLPLAKALVELHGGSLWIKSRTGKGTAVCFTLPVHRVISSSLREAVSA